MLKHTIAIVSVGVALMAPPALADDIILQDGTTIQGVDVQSESLAEVKYTEKGQAKSITPGSKVKTILYESMPEELDNGLGFLNAGKYRKAIDDFNATVSSGSGWEKEYAYHGLGKAWLMLGLRKADGEQIGKAISSLDQLVATNSKTRFLIEAHMLKGFCYRVQKKYSEAVAAYEAAKAAASANGIGDGWPERAQCGAGWAQLESGKAKEAMATFESATSSSDKSVKREALSGWSEAAAAVGETTKVSTRMEGMRSGADRATLGVVNNGVGVVLFTQKKYAAARLHFVKTVSRDFADSNAHARAMYYAGACYRALKEPASYTNAYWRELRSRYPLTHWALKAR